MGNIAKQQSTTRADARNQFFRTVKRKSPKILRSLADKILPLYRGIYRSGTTGIFEDSELPVKLLSGFTVRLETGMTLTYADSLPFEGDALETIAQFQRAFRKWAEDGHITNQWCIERALLTLDTWYHSDKREDLDWEYEGELDFSLLVNDPEANQKAIDQSIKPMQEDKPSPDIKQRDRVSVDQHYVVYCEEIEGISLDTDEFIFKHPAWNNSDTWPSYRTKVEAAFKIALKEYHSRMNLEAGKNIRRGAIQKREDSHYVWLVEYQINELPITKANGKSIVSIYGGRRGLDEGTISQALNRTAELIGLTLRANKRGRPRKQKRYPLI